MSLNYQSANLGASLLGSHPLLQLCTQCAPSASLNHWSDSLNIGPLLLNLH